MLITVLFSRTQSGNNTRLMPEMSLYCTDGLSRHRIHYFGHYDRVSSQEHLIHLFLHLSWLFSERQMFYRFCVYMRKKITTPESARRDQTL